MLRIVLPCVLVLALVSSAGADDCTTWSTWNHNLVEADAPTGRYYVFYDCFEGGPCGLFVYQESNGLGGLQRDDEIRDDTCHGLFEPDTVIFL